MHGGILRREEVNAHLAYQHVAVDTQDALELPVAEQQTTVAAVHIDHDWRVVEHATQALLDLIRRSLQRREG